MTRRRQTVDLICTGEYRHVNTVLDWAEKLPTKCMCCRATLERFDGRRRDHAERPEPRKRRSSRTKTSLRT